MATFSHLYLPAELVEYIYSYLDQADLYAASQLNKALHALALPFLYRHVDLFIRPGDKLPRIDCFCMNISKHRRLAASVQSVRLGPSPHHGVKEGQRWLPRDPHFDDDALFEMAMAALDTVGLVSKVDYLRDAIHLREYSAYAVLIIIMLPALQTLHLADFARSTLDHLHTVLRNLNPGSDWNTRRASDSLIHRLSHINTAVMNFDRLTGVAYPRASIRSNLDPVLNLPGILKLEISVPDVGEGRSPTGPVSNFTRRLTTGDKMRNITTLVVRHSDCSFRLLQPLLRSITQLRSFTYDFFYDCKDREDVPSRWIDLFAWGDSLPKSLQTLILSVENCDTSAFPFKQPRMGEKVFGYLDLTNMVNLHTIEVPFPFLTGDVEFSITADIYPLLPPNLRHLSLRTDMSHAQHQFPFDTSLLPRSLTFQESEDEARHLINARMDVSYMFHAALILLDFATNLETIAVWQPADASLNWFDGQVDDFAKTCRNKSISGLLLYPMILRKRKLEYWNLVKELTVHDTRCVTTGYHEALCRRGRAGIPLGLASQYHIHALQNHQMKPR